MPSATFWTMPAFGSGEIVLLGITLFAAQWAYSVLLVAIVLDGCLLYVFFTTRRLISRDAY
jgi:hypothetical protein